MVARYGAYRCYFQVVLNLSCGIKSAAITRLEVYGLARVTCPSSLLLLLLNAKLVVRESASRQLAFPCLRQAKEAWHSSRVCCLCAGKVLQADLNKVCT